MAIRMCQACKCQFSRIEPSPYQNYDLVGLHVRIPDGKIGNDDRIERNWVFWNTFIHVRLSVFDSELRV